MSHSNATVRLVQFIVFSIVMYATIQLAIFLGFEEKSWWQKSWEILTGGFLGASVGVLFFLVVGAVGWVSGPIFGALGLFGLMMGGALGGMGLGALANIIRNPDDYNIDIPTVLAILLLGIATATWLIAAVGRYLSSDHSHKVH